VARRTAAKMAGLLGRESIEVAVSRSRSQSREAEFPPPRWLVWCWWLPGRSIQYLIRPSHGVGSDQHQMVHLPRCVSQPNRDMHRTGQACGDQTMSCPAGGRDLCAGRLMTKVGGRSGSHTNHVTLIQSLCQHPLPGNHPDRRRTR
jgi:hypothetical protein